MNPRHWVFVPLVAALATLAGCKGRPKPIPDTGPPRVTVATPKVDEVRLFTDLTGSVAAPEMVQVRPRVGGFIKEVLFKEGQTVEKDKTALFQIDPVNYDADLQQAKAQVDIAKAKLDLAEKDEIRAKQSYDRGVTSKQEYDTYVAKSAVARAELAATQGPVTKAEQNVKWTRVMAPISGRIDRAMLTAGNVVVGGETQGTILTTIVSTDPMYVYFDVDDQTVSTYQQLIKEEKLQQIDGSPVVKAEIKLLSDKDYTRTGEITFASNQLNPGTGTLAVRGIFKNTDKMLLPGRYVRGRVPRDEPFPGLLIPQDAVVTDQNEKLVYVVNAENKVEARRVKLGALSKGLRLVEDGLTKSDRVIIRGVQRVQPGDAVEAEMGTIDYPALDGRKS